MILPRRKEDLSGHEIIEKTGCVIDGSGEGKACKCDGPAPGTLCTQDGVEAVLSRLYIVPERKVQKFTTKLISQK